MEESKSWPALSKQAENQTFSLHQHKHCCLNTGSCPHPPSLSLSPSLHLVPYNQLSLSAFISSFYLSHPVSLAFFVLVFFHLPSFSCSFYCPSALYVSTHLYYAHFKSKHQKCEKLCCTCLCFPYCRLCRSYYRKPKI